MALNPSNSSNLEQLALKGLTLICQKIKTSRDLDHAHFGAVCHHGTTHSRWKDPRTPRSVNRGSHICIWGASYSLAPALVATSLSWILIMSITDLFVMSHFILLYSLYPLSTIMFLLLSLNYLTLFTSESTAVSITIGSFDTDVQKIGYVDFLA